MTVEDGTGLTTANSYESVVNADAYHLARGNSSWAAATTANKETALVRSTQALDGMYGRQWPGIRLTSDQSLDWPRDDALDTDGYELTGVPQGIKDATCEGALVELGSAGALSAALDQSVESIKVGPIEKKMRSGGAKTKTYPGIVRALRRILPGASGCIALERA